MRHDEAIDLEDEERPGPSSQFRIGLVWGLLLSSVLWVALFWLAYQFWADRQLPETIVESGTTSQSSSAIQR